MNSHNKNYSEETYFAKVLECYNFKMDEFKRFEAKDSLFDKDYIEREKRILNDSDVKSAMDNCTKNYEKSIYDELHYIPIWVDDCLLANKQLDETLLNSYCTNGTTTQVDYSDTDDDQSDYID